MYLRSIINDKVFLLTFFTVMYSTAFAKPMPVEGDTIIPISHRVNDGAENNDQSNSVTFDVPQAASSSKHRRFPSIQSVTVPKEPREGDVDIERGVGIPTNGIIRANTGMNTRTAPGWRSEMLAWQNEFSGQVVFLTLAFGGIHAGNSNLENALAFGISLAVAVQLFGQQFMNPTIALCHAIIGEISPLRAVSMVTAELTGAIAASALIKGLTGKIPGVVNLAGVNVVQGLFIETVISLVLAYLVLLISHEKHQTSYNTPLTVGATLVALELFSIPFTSGSANFARYLGPAVIARNFHSYDWIYFVSNVIGGVSASAYYKFVRAVQTSSSIEPIIGPALAKPNINRITEEAL